MFRYVLGAAALAVGLGSASPAKAGMTLTAAGISEGFTLSTFADGFPSGGGVGPVGITYTNTGGVMVSEYNQGRVAVFAADVDGQHYSGATLSSSFYGGNDPAGLARTSNGNIYMARQQAGTLVQVDQNGNFLATIASGLGSATGIATNPNNDHLFVSNVGGGSTIYDIDPTTGNKVVFKSVAADGLTATNDTLFAEVGGHILGFRISDGAQVFDSGFINGADGAAAGTGTLAGKVYVNTNFGQVVEVNVATNTQTVIATGGSRGDLVSVDPSNGTLLLTQTDSVLRLQGPAGGGFGSGSATPEPASVTLLALGAVGMLGYRLRRRHASA
jgi:hypothetical protein